GAGCPSDLLSRTVEHARNVCIRLAVAAQGPDGPVAAGQPQQRNPWVVFGHHWISPSVSQCKLDGPTEQGSVEVLAERTTPPGACPRDGLLHRIGCPCPVKDHVPHDSDKRSQQALPDPSRQVLLPVGQRGYQVADRLSNLNCCGDRNPKSSREHKTCRDQYRACNLITAEGDRDDDQSPSGHGEADPGHDPGSPVARRQVTAHRIPQAPPSGQAATSSWWPISCSSSFTATASIGSP